MTRGETIEAGIHDILAERLEEREGWYVPRSENVSLTRGAVVIEGAFLYADLAGSAAIAAACPWQTTARILRAYLAAATRLMRMHGGEVRSFDGDRAMAVFAGAEACQRAVRCALEIQHITDEVLAPAAQQRFSSIRNNGVDIRQACGVDVGVVRAVRTGIRNNNDLIWVGRPASLAAKLSDLRAYPYCTFITSAVHDHLCDDLLCFPDGSSLWERRQFTFAAGVERIYRSDALRRC